MAAMTFAAFIYTSSQTPMAIATVATVFWVLAVALVTVNPPLEFRYHAPAMIRRIAVVLLTIYIPFLQ